MNRYPLWRYILILVLLVLGVIYALPNLYGTAPAVQISNAASSPLTQATVDRIQAALKSKHIPVQAFEPQDHSLMILFKEVEDQLQAQDVTQTLLGSNYSVALNLASKSPAWLGAFGAEPMKLGLDLRGGIHFLMYVNVKEALKSRLQGDMRSMTATLRKAQIRYKGVSVNSDTLSLRFASSAIAKNAQDKLQSTFPAYGYAVSTKNGANHLDVMMSATAVRTFEINTMEQTMTILRNRVNAIGVSEPIVQQQGKEYISIDLPGIQNSARAKKLIGTAATVQMQLIDDKNNAEIAKQTGVVPFGSKLYDYDGRPILVNDNVILGGTAITNATGGIGQNGKPEVNVTSSGPQVSQFYRITGENIGKLMAVVYLETITDVKKNALGKQEISSKQEAKIISVATIQAALANSFVITNMESMQTAQNLALLLRSGAYPIAPAFVEEQIVGPSMGKENIEKGELSTAVGFLLVVLFMLFYYRFFGFVADLALFVNLIFIVAIMSILQATLTLPGIAGIVLTIGMAVDANVLINERIREELRLGMSPQAAINAGYGRAFSTIIDANVTTLIVAVVLFGIGSGPVKNFAITLIIGLLTSMLSAIFFTRAVVNLHYGRHLKLDRLSIGIRVKKSEEKT